MSASASAWQRRTRPASAETIGRLSDGPDPRGPAPTAATGAESGPDPDGRRSLTATATPCLMVLWRHPLETTHARVRRVFFTRKESRYLYHSTGPPAEWPAPTGPNPDGRRERPAVPRGPGDASRLRRLGARGGRQEVASDRESLRRFGRRGESSQPGCNRSGRSRVSDTLADSDANAGAERAKGWLDAPWQAAARTTGTFGCRAAASPSTAPPPLWLHHDPVCHRSGQPLRLPGPLSLSGQADKKLAGWRSCNSNAAGRGAVRRLQGWVTAPWRDSFFPEVNIDAKLPMEVEKL